MGSLSVEELNARFAAEGVAEVIEGQGGLPLVRVTTPASTAEVYLHGAQITSWVPLGGKDVIFLSEKSAFEAGKAIRGGIPICFPWFRGKADNPKAPSHGLVRTREWELASVEQVGDTVRVDMTLESDATMQVFWSSPFRIQHRVTVGPELELELVVTNMGSAPMRYAEALHTYHLVGDAEQVRVQGLNGVTYLDNMDGNKEKTQEGDVRFTGQTDSAYMKTESALSLADPVLGRTIVIEKSGSSTTVVWNPWADGAAKLADLGDDEWRAMACVEASNILGGQIELAPGASHAMTAKISVEAGN